MIKMIKTSNLILVLLFTPIILWGETAEVIHGQKVYFQKMTRDGQGRVRGGILSKQAIIQQGNLNIVIADNENLQLYKDGQLKSIVLGGDLNIPSFLGEIPVKKGSKLQFENTFDLNLRKCRLILREDAWLEIGGYLVPLKKSSSLFFLDNKTLDYARSDFILNEYTDLTINGINFKAKVDTPVEFHDSGSIKSIILGSEMILSLDLGNVSLIEDVQIFFTPEQKIDFVRSAFFLKDNAELTIHNQLYTFKAGTELKFYLNGMVKYGYVIGDRSVKLFGYDLIVGGDTMFAFDPGGFLDPSKSDFILSEDTTIKVGENLIVFKKGKNVAFYNNGVISFGTLAKGADLKVYGKIIPLAKDTDVFFKDDGMVDILKTDLVLDRPTLIDVAGLMLSLKEGTRLYMNMDGKLEFQKTEIRLAEAAKIKFKEQDLTLLKDSVVQFYPEGGIKRFVLGENIIFLLGIGKSNIEFYTGTTFSISENGYVDSVILSKNTLMRGAKFSLSFMQGTAVHFSEDGLIKKGNLALGNILTIGSHKVPLPEKMEILFSIQGDPVIIQVTLPKDAEFVINRRNFSFNEGSILYFNSNKDIDLEKSQLYIAKPGPFIVGANNLSLNERAKIDFLKSGEIKSVYVNDSQDLIIGKLKLPFLGERNLFFLKDGSINPIDNEIILADDIMVQLGENKLPLAKDTRIYFQENGLLDFEKIKISLGKNSKITAGNYVLPLKKGTVLEYHLDGGLDIIRTEFILHKDLNIKVSSVKYVFGKDNRVFFHENGEIAKAFIRDNVQVKLDINACVFKGARNFSFLKTGKINLGETVLELAEDTIIKVRGFSIPFKQGQILSFHPNGFFKSGVIKEPVTLNVGGKDLIIKKDNILYFDENGYLDTKLTQVILDETLELEIGNNTIPFLKGTRIYFYDTGEVWQGIIAKEMLIKVFDYEIPFKKGKRLYFYKNGKVDLKQTELYLIADKLFPIGRKEFMFKQNKRVYFDKVGKITKGWLSNTKEVNVGSETYRIDLQNPVEFYADGSIKYLYLSSATVVNIVGQKVELSEGSQVQFYSNGFVKQGELKNDTVLKSGTNTITLKYFSKVEFYSNGSLKKGELKESSWFEVGSNRVFIDKKEPVEFYENSELKRGLLARQIKMDLLGRRIVLKNGSYIGFYPNNVVAFAEIDEILKLSIAGKKVEINPGPVITFYDNWQLKDGYLRFPISVTIKGFELLFDNRAPITFYKNGEIKEGVLAEHSFGMVGGKNILFSGGSRIFFYPDGSVEKGFPVEIVQLEIESYSGQIIKCSSMKELHWDTKGRILYANLSESFVYKTSEGERFSIDPGEWIVVDYPQKNGPQIYPIDLLGRVRKDTPFYVAGEKIVFPKESIVAFKGDDTIFTVVLPSEHIIYKDQVVANRHLEIFYSDLEQKINNMKGGKAK